MKQRKEEHSTVVDSRLVFVTAIAMVLGLAAGIVAQVLIRLIGFITNITFFGRLSDKFVTPAGNTLGPWAILIPIAGGLVVGLMARFGSEKIRGHGIPEAMEQVLANESRIPARLTILKPLSAAISIGTGGPFGAEGPIIATGGALGSLIGQLLEMTASERKTLLAAGAAAGLTATFGNPVSSVLLAIELLLFEFSPRSILPVALSCSVAAAVRIAFMGTGPAFAVGDLPGSGALALAIYVVIGALIGAASVYVTSLVSWVEHQFEKIPVHWMFYPAIGGIVVGVIGWKLPHTMGPGYDTIEDILGGKMMAWALLYFLVFKLISWATSVGSGTSGGTLAPMFAIGGCMGGALATAAALAFPQFGISIGVAALVGMAAIFAGASRALFGSILLAFETTHQFQAVLPLLAGCTAAYLVSGLMMKHTIMTEKFLKAGMRVPEEFVPDPLGHILVASAATKDVVTINADDTIATVRAWLATGAKETLRAAYPVAVSNGNIVGVVMRNELLAMEHEPLRRVSELVRRPAVSISPYASLQEALQLMLLEDVGRLLVVSGEAGAEVKSLRGILSRSDIQAAYSRGLRTSERRERTIHVSRLFGLPQSRGNRSAPADPPELTLDED